MIQTNNFITIPVFLIFFQTKLLWSYDDHYRLVINNSSDHVKNDEEIFRKFTQDDAKDIVDNVNPKEVKGVRINHIELVDTAERLFTFLSDCSDCTEILLYQMKDNTQNNKDLSQALEVAFKRWQNLSEIEISHTEFGENWGSVLNSIHSSCILRFDQSNLTDQYWPLGRLLARCPSLVCLSLKHTGLADDELKFILSKLPSYCPSLKGLLVEGHNLSSGGKELAEVVRALPDLKWLNISKCHLKEDDLCAILENINESIETLEFHHNDAFLKGVPECIKKFKSLKFLSVSLSQFSSLDLSQLHAILLEHDGSLIENK